MIKRELFEAIIGRRKIKIGDILYSKYNGCPFEVRRIRAITTDEGIFGLEETYTYITVKNLNTGKEIELGEWHITTLLK